MYPSQLTSVSSLNKGRRRLGKFGVEDSSSFGTFFVETVDPVGGFGQFALATVIADVPRVFRPGQGERGHWNENEGEQK